MDADGPLPQGRLRRGLPVAGLTARTAGERVVADLRESAGASGLRERVDERSAHRYAELFGRSKGVLMKAAQMFCVIDAAMAEAGELSPYQRAYAQMYAEAPVMDPELVALIVRTDLGQPVDELFSEFGEAPHAVGSIGQVHRGVLHDGRSVVVKVQYPGVAEAIRADLANAELVVAIWGYLQAVARTKMPNLREITTEVGARIAEEIDYRHEAANITAFHRLFAGHPFFRIPEVIEDRCGDRVLTMTYLEGLDWKEARRADQDLRDAWSEAIFRFFFGSYRHGSLFHGDPHPDNVRFGTDGSIGIVDFGCVQPLSERRRHHFVALPHAAVSGTKQDIVRTMVEAGFVWHDPSVTPDDLYRWWLPLVAPLVAPQPVLFGGDDFRDMARGMMHMSDDPRLRDMRVPAEHAFTARMSVSFVATLVALRSELHVRSCMDDMDGVAEPVTEMGREHVAWVRRRGLPFGLDDHTASRG